MSNKNERDLIIQEIVMAQIRRELALIETVCEKSIQSGEHGVLVIRNQMHELISVTVSDQVPYGRLHEMRIDVPPS